MKAIYLVAYPMHAVILNISLSQRRFLIYKGYPIVVLLPIGFAVYLYEDKDGAEKVRDYVVGNDTRVPIPLDD